MKRRQLTLLILLILGVALWLTRGWWLPQLLTQIPALEKRADLIQTIDSLFSIVALMVNLGMGYLLWLTHQQQEERRTDELAPLRATTWQTIRERSPQGARVAWIDRGATDANAWRSQPRLALIGLSGEGKSREAAELIRRAVELDLVAATKVFEPNRDFLHAGAALTTAVLEKVVEPTQRSCLFIDDLHSYSVTTLEHLATLLALFTPPQVDHRYVIATVRSDLVSAEQQTWLQQQGFHLVRLPKIDAKQAEQWLTSAGQVHSMTLSKKVRQTFIEQNQPGTPGHFLRGLLTIKSTLADNNKGQASIKPAQVAAVMSDLTAQERQALYRRQPLAAYLLTALAHFHAAQVRTAKPLILAYAARHYRRDHRLFNRWQAWWRSQTLHRTLTYLLNFDVTVQDGLIVAPDAMLESTAANDARRCVGDFLVAYCHPFHNRLLRRFHRHAEDQRWALFDLAEDYRQRQEHATAARFYTTAISVAPHFGFYVNRGVARSEHGLLAEAITDYNQAIALNPQYSLPYTNRGIARKEQGLLARAIQDYDQAIAINPQDDTAFYNRGIARHDQGLLDSAIADYDAVIALNPRDAVAYNNRGNIRADQGELLAAIADYDQAIALNPQYAIAYYHRGIANTDQGKLIAAIADYDAAIALFPNGKEKAAAYYNRGNSYADQKEWAAAIADYDAAIALFPNGNNKAAAYCNRGNSHYAQRELAAAVADYDQAIALNPQDVIAFYRRGNARRDQGLLDAAIQDYQRALKKNSKLPDQGLRVYRSLGAALREQTKWQDALTTYQQALTLDDSRLSDWIALADVARCASQEAIWQEALAQARRRLPADDAYNSASLESVAGNVEEALAAMTKAAQADDFDPAWASKDPDLAGVRADSRFAEIMDKIIDKKDIDADKLEQAEGERQVTVAETKSASKM